MKIRSIVPPALAAILLVMFIATKSVQAQTVNCAGVAAWSASSVSYAVGALVTYDGDEYKCLQAHTSETGWDPVDAPALWSEVGTCTVSTTSTTGPTCSAVPSAPAGLTASGTTTTSTTLTWTVVTPPTACAISGYTIYEGGTSIGTSTAATFTVTGLTPSTKYAFTVAASDVVGTGAQSSSISVTTAAAEGPYGGTPAAVPGTIQAENYDTGGQGVGYSVSSVNGTGNSYRSDGIDLETTTDTGGGYNVGWTAAGQWFRYTVNVATAGTYTVTFRLAAPTAVTGGLHLASSTGTNLSGEVNVPATGGWQDWTNVTASVTLPAGQQVLTLDQDAAGWNINYFSFAPKALAAPTALTATGGNSQVTLGWTASAGATSYNVYRGTTSGGESTTPIATGVTGTSYADTAVTNGTTYYYTVKAINAGGTSAASNEASATPKAAAVEGPYGGTPAAVPGTIQAENYDTGGQGLGYSVSSVNGSANIYRSDGVDLETTTDTGGGYDLGWTAAGQWFRYTVNVAAANTYTVTFRVAAMTAATGALHLANSAGTNLSGEVNVPATGGWQDWTNVTATVTLPAGQQVLTVDQDAAGWNINYLSITPAVPPAPTALAATGGNAKVGLTWTASTGAASYNVYRGTSTGAESTTPLSTGLTGTSFTDSTAANGTTYYYTVAAVNANGTSAMSNEASATPAAPGSAYGGTPAAIPGIVQAENYDTGGQGVAYNVATNSGTDTTYRTDGVDLEVCTDTGGGVDLGWTAAGQWFHYTVNVATAGAYTVAFRVASGASGGSFHLANSAGTSLTGPVTAPSTGGWQSWTTVQANVTLPAGEQVLTLDVDSAGFNINYFQFTSGATSLPPNFGPNVMIFNPTMSMSSIQTTVNNIWNQQNSNQFGTQRYAFLFMPGTYSLDVPIGYYTQMLGLGSTPDSVLINGYVQQSAELSGNNATCNFWSGAENFAVNPVDSGGTDMWAVSQADPMRRVHVEGNLVLDQDGGYASGGFLGDAQVDGQIQTGSQQQWITRNSTWGSWSGGNWNMVFVGDPNYPGGNFPAFTNVNTAPVIREKPFLQVDSSGNYSVFVPSVRTNASGTTWYNNTEAGTSIPISSFYIAQSSTDNATTINAALAQGKNILLTPGVYVLNGTIQVNNPNTVILGIGLATLQATDNDDALHVADVDGVTIAGILFETASAVNTLVQIGPSGSSASHSSNPTLLSDCFFRVGGAVYGTANVSLQINSNNVIGDDFWIWRADHGNGGTVGWTTNVAANGLVVNGNNVTIYGLAVEHYQQYQTLWNGNGGQTYFYQSECPYDPPSQSSWTDGSENGWPSYKVSSGVTTHQAWGLGIYAVFIDGNSNLVLQNAIECPQTSGVQFTDMVTISLDGTISNIIDNTGNSVSSSNFESTLQSFQ